MAHFAFRRSAPLPCWQCCTLPAAAAHDRHSAFRLEVLPSQELRPRLIDCFVLCHVLPSFDVRHLQSLVNTTYNAKAAWSTQQLPAASNATSDARTHGMLKLLFSAACVYGMPNKCCQPSFFSSSCRINIAEMTHNQQLMSKSRSHEPLQRQYV